MPQLDYEEAGDILEQVFTEVERKTSNDIPIEIPQRLTQHFDLIFSSSTSAYRETLLGCVLARLTDEDLNIRKPYVGQGPDAFNGRTLDERVANPFLQSKEIPCSKGPYLNVFRRNVMFDQETRKGVRDKTGYDAFYALLTQLERNSDAESIRSFLAYLLFRFILLREAAKIGVSKIQRISLNQYEWLIDSLIATPSGGRVPVILVLAAFETIKEVFSLVWSIEFQEILQGLRPQNVILTISPSLL